MPRTPVAQTRGCGSRATPTTRATARRCLTMQFIACHCACRGSSGASASGNVGMAAPWTWRLAHASAVATIGTVGLGRTAARPMVLARLAPALGTGELPKDVPSPTGAHRGTTQSSARLRTFAVQRTLAPSVVPTDGLAPVVSEVALVIEQAAREIKIRPCTKPRLSPHGGCLK